MTAQVIHGDCLEVMRGMTDDSADLVLTDIPYAEVSRSSGGLRLLDRGKADAETFALGDFLQEVTRVCRGSIYIFCGLKQYSFIDIALREAGFSTRCIVWEKTNPSPMNAQHLWLSGIELCAYGKRPGGTYTAGYRNSVLKCPTVPSKDHPTQKPLDLFRELIRVSSKPGDLILDPCAGSGTSGVAAVQEGRRFIGIELDPTYHAVASRRVQNAQPALLSV